jgi:hypothetical protein
MKIWVTTIIVLLALAAGTGAVTYYGMCPTVRPTSAAGDTLVWLRTEFKLNDDQMRRIEALHSAYEDICADHCAAIGEARVELKALRANGADAAALSAAEAKLAAVDGTCRRSTEAHVRAVAAIMGEAQGARYLALVLPRLAYVEHTGAPDLQANSAEAHHGH